MIQDRLNDKEHDLQGVQKQSSELLSIAWQKGYQAGFNDGYATRREAEKRPQGEQIAWEQGYECGKNESRPRGEWIECEDNTSFVRQLPRMWLECSCCKWSCDRGYKTRYKFCPNCGADMRGEKNE